MADPVCDFCMSPKPRWSYDCEDHATNFIDTPEGCVLTHSIGAWAACTRCSRIIDRADPLVLARVAAESNLRRHGVPVTKDELMEYAATLEPRFVELLPKLGPRRKPTPEEDSERPALEVEDLPMQNHNLN